MRDADHGWHLIPPAHGAVAAESHVASAHGGGGRSTRRRVARGPCPYLLIAP